MTYGIGVLPITHDEAATGFAMMLLVILCYITGRAHQYFRQTTEREDAFRDGYNIATKSLFAIATRVARGMPAEPPPLVVKPDKPMRPGFASVPAEARRAIPPKHRAPGRRAPSPADTHRLDDFPNVGQAA